MVKRKTLEKVASRGLVLIFSFTILFHIAILSQLIPYNIVWGGRLTSDTEMYQFELVSISLNIIFLLIGLIRVGVIGVKLHPRVLPIIFWLMAVLFLFNTLGNLVAESTLETLVFTPLTGALTIFCVVLALSK